jgi:cell division protein FtsW
MKHITPSTDEFDKVQKEQYMATAGANNGDNLQIPVEESKSGAMGKRDETRKMRLKRFISGVHPNDPIDDMNRQVVFSKFALAHGGVFGQGPGNSRESARLPLAFSDYIFSIIVEDMGMVGGIAVLVLFLLLIARAGRVAYKCSRAFPAFLIMGCAVMIVAQALVHMAIVTGLFPVSGQPLPFISKGGTSILVMSAALGIMLSVCRFAAHNDDKKQIKEEIESLPEDMQAANYSNS